MGDLDSLLEMGFEKERAELAMKAGNGNLQNALEWLEKNQERELSELKPEAQDADDKEMTAEEEAKSLVCNDCNKRFRNADQATYHATKSGHENFSQSTEEIAPLTAEQSKEKLAELKHKSLARKEVQKTQEREDAKKNELINRKKTKESQEIKEDLQKKEQIKEAAAKRKEKQADIAAKAKIKAKIEADKETRRLKAAAEKAKRDGQPPPELSTPASTSNPAAVSGSGPSTASTKTDARLRLQTPTGTIQKTIPADSLLGELASSLGQEIGKDVISFTSNYPRKTFSGADFGQTLRELGLVPSAALTVGCG